MISRQRANPMSLGLQVRQAAAANETFVGRLWRWLKIKFWHVFYGQNEWQRLCKPTGVDEEERLVRFRTELALSPTMEQTCNVVFDVKPFPMDATLHDVATTAKLDENDATLMANVRSCLHRCNYVNKVYARVYALKNEGYNSSKEEHEEMLEELWTNLKPDVRRKGGRITKEWGEIGFQGTDPMSDSEAWASSRLYNSTTLRKCTKLKLSESTHPTRWYPFAVTGINVTAFMIDLINERLLDIKLYHHAAHDRDDDLNAGLTQLHDVYGTIFTRFNQLWVDLNPRDVMAFPSIFQSLKDDVRLELRRQSFSY